MERVNWLRVCGWAGLLGAALVGIGEFSMQFTPNGGLEDVSSYLFFNDISPARLSFGHFTSVLSAPLYLLGYYFLSKQLEPAGRIQSKVFFLIGAYAFVIGTAWIGQRFFIASTVHEIADGTSLSAMLTLFSEHNEPFVNVLRLAMLIVSGLWIKLILTGQTNLPKWMAIFSPIVLLASIFALYFFKTTPGLYLFPIAMNAAHLIIFALTLMVSRPNKAVA